MAGFYLSINFNSLKISFVISYLPSFVLSQSSENSEGTRTGLENVRLRLQNAFPDSHKLDILEEKGQVKIILQIGSEEKI